VLALMLAACDQGTYVKVTVTSGQPLDLDEMVVTATNAQHTSAPVDLIEAPYSVPPDRSFVLVLNGREGPIDVAVDALRSGAEVAQGTGSTTIVPHATAFATVVLAPGGSDGGATSDSATPDGPPPPVLDHFTVAIAPTTALEHSPIEVTITAVDSTGAPVAGYQGTPTLSTDWGDLNVVIPPTFIQGAATATVDLNRETATQLAHVIVADGAAQGTSASLTIMQPKWSVVDAAAIFTIGSGGFDTTMIQPSWTRVNGTYYLYYLGTNVANYAVGLATSPDGVTWTRAAGNPIFTSLASPAWENTMINAFLVQSSASGFRALYRMNNTYFAIATSTDGVSWTRPTNPSSQTGTCNGLFLASAYYWETDDYALIAEANAPCIAHSTDSQNFPFVKTTFPSGTGTLSPMQILKEGTVYKMWYRSSLTNFYATSTDLVSWTGGSTFSEISTLQTVLYDPATRGYEGLVSGFGRVRRP
jgi:hypothetical protein